MKLSLKMEMQAVELRLSHNIPWNQIAFILFMAEPKKMSGIRLHELITEKHPELRIKK